MKKAFVPISIILVFIQTTSFTQILFRIDMNKPIAEGVFSSAENDFLLIRGSFNNWSGDDFILSDQNNDGIFEETYIVEGDSGLLLEYKYVIKKASGRELWEKQPNRKNQPYGNRVIQLSGKPQKTTTAKFDFDKYYLPLIGKQVIFTVEEMEEDFNAFRNFLESEHCCLYEYTSKKEFDKIFDRQFRLINKPMRPHEFYRIISPITAKIGCGHTAVYMPGGYWETDPENFFPLELKLIGGNAVVSGSYNGSLEIPYGSIIMEINGQHIDSILNFLRANYSADAFNINFINSQIERRFPLIYIRSYGFPENYTVKYTLSDIQKTEVIKLTPASNSSVRAVIFKDFIHPEMKFKIIEERNTAILTIPSFNYYDRVPYFREYIDNFFKLVKDQKIDNLILDLRNNDGGDPFCTAPLLSYLIKEPVPYFAEPYGKYKELSKPMTIPENHFEGNLITFIDGRCFSTNAHFCSLIKYHKVGKMVGTPSGGTYICNAGKNTIKVLNNTSIQLFLGRSSYATAVEGLDKTKPIEPDHHVTETYDDFINGKDVFIEKALQLIEGENKIELY